MNEYKTVSLSLARYDDMSELKDSRMDAFCFLLRSFDCCLDRPSAADTCRNMLRPPPRGLEEEEEGGGWEGEACVLGASACSAFQGTLLMSMAPLWLWLRLRLGLRLPLRLLLLLPLPLLGPGPGEGEGKGMSVLGGVVKAALVSGSWRMNSMEDSYTVR
jgi:hypothetical protein